MALGTARASCGAFSAVHARLEGCVARYYVQTATGPGRHRPERASGASRRVSRALRAQFGAALCPTPTWRCGDRQARARPSRLWCSDSGRHVPTIAVAARHRACGTIKVRSNTGPWDTEGRPMSCLSASSPTRPLATWSGPHSVRETAPTRVTRGSRTVGRRTARRFAQVTSSRGAAAPRWRLDARRAFAHRAPTAR